MAEPLHANAILKNNFQVRMLFIKEPVFFLLLLFLMFFSSNLLQAQITSTSNDDWNSSGTWDSGSVPTASDNVTVDNVNGNTTITVTVQSGTTAEANNLDIGQNGKLVIDGTLIVYGNLTMANNDPELIAGSDATIIIHGDAIISNKVNINLSSYFIVLGDFTIDGGGATDININDASIYVFGSFDGGSTGLTICEYYDNNTDDYDNEECHIGTESAFNENVEDGLVPDEITELVDLCDASATISDEAKICEGELVAYLSFSSTTADTYNLDFDATAECQGFSDVSGTTLSGSEIEIIVPANIQSDTYNAGLTVTNSTTGCTSEVYNITVVIYPLPATGGIIPD